MLRSWCTIFKKDFVRLFSNNYYLGYNANKFLILEILNNNSKNPCFSTFYGHIRKYGSFAVDNISFKEILNLPPNSLSLNLLSNSFTKSFAKVYSS